MSYSEPPPPPQYGAPSPYGAGGGGGDHPRATTILVLGIVSIVCCSILGPVAVVMGKNALQEIDASGGRIGGRSSVKAGYICGIIGCVLLVLGILYAILVLAIGIGSTSTN